MTSGPYNSQYAPPQPLNHGQQYSAYAPAAAYPPGYGYPPGYPNPYGAAPTHAGIGVASFILGLIASLTMLALIVIAGVLAAKAPGQQLDENSTEAMTVGCSLLLAAGMALLGLILGIVAALQNGKKKVFPILGIVFNGGMLLMVVAMMILGAAMG